MKLGVQWWQECSGVGRGDLDMTLTWYGNISPILQSTLNFSAEPEMGAGNIFFSYLIFNGREASADTHVVNKQ